MGCGTSRIGDSDVVKQCRQRKGFIKDAVNFRQDFAIAHLAYIETLRNVGRALHRFAQGDFPDTHTSPPSPKTPPVLPLPQTSSPPVVAALSPPHPAPVQSPPPSARPAPSSPSTPPLKSPGPPPLLSPSTTPRESPPTSPFLDANSPPPVEDASPYADMSRSYSMPPFYSGNQMASPDRGSDFSPPYYSPARDDSDDFFATFPPLNPRTSMTPPPPPPQAESSSWFYNFFDTPEIPSHLEEQRRMRHEEELEDDEVQNFDHVQEEERIPDLEEEEQKEDGKEHSEKNDEGQTVEEKAPEIVVDNSEQKLEEVSENLVENASDKGDEEEEKPTVVSSVGKEVDIQSDPKGKEKNELTAVTTVRGSDLTHIVRHIDDNFARAYDSGKDVSTMLETKMVHHHLGIFSKDPTKAFNAITWHWSHKSSLAMRDAYEDSDVPECGMAGSHASTLERLYAWEKKLYDEVKAGERIRIDFDRKCKQLSNLDARGEDPNLIDKTRAAVKKLDTRLMVALRAVHSASMRIQQLTNDELYPQLAELLGGLSTMWKVMLECHRTQKEIAMEMQTLKNSIAGDEVSEGHRKATIELEQELDKWHQNFHRWISSQKKYIHALFSWLDKCHMEPETDVKGRGVSPHWIAEGAPIRSLTKAWLSSLVWLEERQKVVDAVSDFAAAVHSLEMAHIHELNLKRQAERSEKDLVARDDKADLDTLRAIVEEERLKHSKAIKERRDTTLGSLKANLPTVFEAMTSFATDALDVYEKLQQAVEGSSSPPKENGDVHQISEK